MRVLVVDDDPLVGESLRTILEADSDIEVVGIGRDGDEVASLYKDKMPDVLLLDIRMERMSGLGASRSVLSSYPDARILFLTTFLDDEYIVEALRLGAKGYILKQDFESIIPAVRAVHMGQSVFGDAIATRLPELLRHGGRPDLQDLGFAPREEDMIRLVSQGRSNKEISKTLHLSEGTVRNYLSAILAKLGLRDRTQLAVFYLGGKCKSEGDEGI